VWHAQVAQTASSAVWGIAILWPITVVGLIVQPSKVVLAAITAQVLFAIVAQIHTR